MNSADLNQLFSLFFPRYIYEGKEWMRHANSRNGYVYATDSNALIRIVADKCTRKFDCFSGVPDFEKIISSIAFHEPIKITRSELIRTLIQFNLVPQKVICDHCQGHDIESCLYCDQNGEVNDLISLPIFPFESFIKIQNVYISPYYLNKLVGTMTLAGKEHCFQIAGFGQSKSPQVYQVGDFEIILMPMDPDEEQLQQYKLVELHHNKIYS